MKTYIYLTENQVYFVFVVDINRIATMIWNAINLEQIFNRNLNWLTLNVVECNKIMICLVFNISITCKNRSSVYTCNRCYKRWIMMTHLTQDYFDIEKVFYSQLWFTKPFIFTCSWLSIKLERILKHTSVLKDQKVSTRIALTRLDFFLLFYLY